MIVVGDWGTRRAFLWVIVDDRGGELLGVLKKTREVGSQEVHFSTPKKRTNFPYAHTIHS